MDRTLYFEKLRQVESPLMLLNEDLSLLIDAAATDATDVLLSFAQRLAAVDDPSAKARAAFIRLQCAGINTEDLFEEYREGWGIPKFEDDLVSINDFKNGFLWTFRDHTSSWSEDNEARDWFYMHTEARFARRYEFWCCDHGPEEMLLLESGDYKSLLWSIVHKHVDYSAFVSPVFTLEELHAFYNDFDEAEYDFDKDTLLEIMEQNANWK